MVFYKGGISYQDFSNMPIPEILEWQYRAKIIADEYNKELNKLQKQ
jgi:hypothetical protein